MEERTTSWSWGWEIGLTVLVLVLLSYSWLWRAITAPNERSRIYLAVSMVDRGTVSIDEPVKKWGKSFDIAKYDGEYRGDKAPGSSLLAMVAYGTVRLWTAPEDWTFTELLDLMRFWVMIPLSLFAFLALRVALRELGLDPPVVDVASLAWILGSSAFHYSNAFFGHQIVGATLIGALACLLVGERRLVDGRAGQGRALAAAGGALAGLAGMTEYPAAIPCILMASYVLLGPARRDRWALLTFIGGALPFALGLLWYHQAAFGGPLELPYFHLVNQTFDEVHTTGLGGLKWPQWEWFFGGILSLHRGLLGTSPVYILVLPGLWALWRVRERRVAALTGAIFLYYVVFISSWPLWEGGWGYGPRHLVAMLGIASVPMAVGVGWAWKHWAGRGIAVGLALVGILSHQIVGAFFPELKPVHENPLMDGVRVWWSEGMVGPNLLTHYTQLDGLVTLIPLGVMVAAVVIYLLVRAARGRWGALGAIVVALGVVAGAGYGIHSMGTTLDDTQEEKAAGFMKLLKGMEADIREESAEKGKGEQGER